MITNSTAIPKVSIIIRSINRYSLLQSAISSVLKQSYQNIELLIVDALPDDSISFYSSHNSPFTIRKISTDYPLSRSEAANKGLSFASGEFCLFLDDDDEILEHHISNLIKPLISDSHKSVVATYSDYYKRNESGTITELVKLPEFQRLLYLTGNFVPIHCLLFRKPDQIKFDVNIDYYEDWDFFLNLSQNSNFIHVSYPGAIYRIHNSSGVHEKNENTKNFYLTVFNKWIKLLSFDSVTEFHSLIYDFYRKLPQLEKEVVQLEYEVTNLHNEISILNNTISIIKKSRTWLLIERLHILKRFFLLITHKKFLKVKSDPLNRYLLGSTKIIDYQSWLTNFDYQESNIDKYKNIQAKWTYQPLFSIILPTYNSNLNWLIDCIGSVQNQVYRNWQICIADDHSNNQDVITYLSSLNNNPKIKVIFNEKNLHISGASNVALSQADGDFIVLLDHDDLLHPLALWHLCQLLQTKNNAQIIYSDEDIINSNGVRQNPYFKPDFNLDLFYNQNLISHLGCYRKSLIDSIGGFRIGYEGSQDYDLALRAIEKISIKDIHHIPHVLYHWRQHENSTASSVNAKPYAVISARKALEEHFSRTSIVAKVFPSSHIPFFHRIRYSLKNQNCKVSIIIPTKDKVDLLRACVSSIHYSNWHNFEVIIINNNSVEKDTFDLLNGYIKQGIKVINDNNEFNYSRLNNIAVREATGDYLCFMNNDVEVISEDWCEEMLGFAQQENVGAVGAKLLYPNRQVQHVGVIVGWGGVAGHAHLNLNESDPGYFGRAVLQHSVSAVTGACLMVSKDKFNEVGGFEESLKVNFNDVDFCLKLQEKGYRNIINPYALLYHHESVSRGRDTTREQLVRFNQEVEFMRKRWRKLIINDPNYSPNLTLRNTDFTLANPPRISMLDSEVTFN